MSVPGPSICVLGCGVMGAGIARVFSHADMPVSVYDADHQRAASLAASLGSGASAAGSVEEAVHGAEYVFEAVPEVVHIKEEVLGRAGEANGEAVIASNTSSLQAEALSKSVPRAERFVIAHFFNPADLVPLVEVVPTVATRQGLAIDVAELLRQVGKQPVVLDRAVPGFVANRLQSALLREAFALQEAGVASFEAIDLIVRAGLGSRWAAAGPFAVVDLGGLDVWNAVCAQLFPLLAQTTTAPDALTERVAAGDLGAKSGRGLQAHDAVEDEVVRRRIAAHFALEFGSPAG
ncbi:3-hydroxyacyl-CoA dehydrogenase family protein [Microbacterium sp.]|uniref:3-hydroxyacyl-CoA dehydrogenase family protein n=1 Tax=Microbacterium sp. TaxID=51671 RepID=UPI003F94A264